MREMNARRVNITMRDGSVFRGYINIGSCRRISDFFRKTDNSPFIVMFETAIGESKEKSVYFLNLNHVLWVEPYEDDREGSSGSLALESELK
ncbi:MAG: hypothetical protein ABSF52_10945 [Syntrophobacteraceae bacterium]